MRHTLTNIYFRLCHAAAEERRVVQLQRAKCKTCGFEVVNNAAPYELQCGTNQNPDETRQAIDYIRETAGENIMPELTNYMAKVPPYNEYLFAEGYKKVESEAWWRSGLRLGFSKELVDYASTLANAISSSAGLERCFSTLGLTYGKLRSSLGVEKAGKLAFLFKQLNE